MHLREKRELYMFHFFRKKCLVKLEWKILNLCYSVDGILELKRMGMVMAVVTDGCMKTREQSVVPLKDDHFLASLY